MNHLLFFILIGFAFACKQQEDIKTRLPEKTEKVVDHSQIAEIEKKKQINQVITDSLMLQSNLVDIQKVNPSIQVELKYATADNFIGEVLYSKITRAYLQKDVAERLSNCQNYLKTIHPNYSLLVYDAVRPVSVQQKMWDALDTIPRSERGKFVSNPAHRSLHNYGAAVDITIVDERGKPLDMGAHFDDIRKIAYPSLEARFLESGELTQQQVENRKLLRKVMSSEGFRNLPTEWWHFNACSRDAARLKYTSLKEEPLLNDE